MQQTNTPPAAKPAKPKPPSPPSEFQEKDIATMDAAGLVAIIKDAGQSAFRRAKACQRAGELGSKEAIPAMAALLGDERLSSYARYGLEPIADPAADDALRAAIPKLKGVLLMGVINSIAKRRDAKASPALVKMMYGQDAALAQAAAAALGSIGDLAASKELQAALGKTTGATRMAVADASLICAERLIAEGKREQGFAMYTALSAPNIPKPARLAAMAGIIREETAIGRPR